MIFFAEIPEGDALADTASGGTVQLQQLRINLKGVLDV